MASASPTATAGLGYFVMDVERAPDQTSLADAVMSDVVNGGPGLVAVGTVTDPATNAQRPVAWLSADGLAWRRVDLTSASRQDVSLARSTGSFPDWDSLSGISASGSGFVAVGTGIWTSPDESTWDRLVDLRTPESPGDHVLQAVKRLDDGRFIAVGRHGAAADVWMSSDGRSWREVSPQGALQGVGGTTATMFDVIRGGPGIVGVGAMACCEGPGDAAVWTSPDGRAWKRIDGGDLFANRGMTRLVTLNGRYLAFGVQTEFTSTDGLHWQIGVDDLGFPPEDALVDGGTVYVAAEGGSPLARSVNGVTWELVEPRQGWDSVLTTGLVRFGSGFAGVGLSYDSNGGQTANAWVAR